MYLNLNACGGQEVRLGSFRKRNSNKTGNIVKYRRKDYWRWKGFYGVGEKDERYY